MKRNFAYTAVSVGSRLLVGLLLFLLLARLWGPAQFGLFSFVFSYSALLVLLVDFGFAVYLLREVAARPDDAARLVAESLRAKLVLLLVAMALLIVSGWAIGPATLPPSLVAPLFMAALAMSFADFFVAPLRALGRYDLEAGLVALANVLQFVLAGTVAWHGGSPMAVGWAMLGSRLVYLALALRATRKVLPQLRLREPVAAGPLATLRRAWPYGVDGMLATAWNQLDVVAVRVLFGTQAVGVYSAGQKIVLGVSALAPVVGNVMIPRLSSLAVTKSQYFGRDAKITGGLLLAIGLFFALPLIIYPDAVASLLFGVSYRNLESILPIFGLVLIAKFLGAAAGVTATAAGLQFKRIVAQLTGMAVAVLALPLVIGVAPMLQNFVLIVLAASVVTAILNYWNVYRSGIFRIGGTKDV
ncbi:MAG: oligosaccharide flippase family protein [Burkholderiaceae bacterium]|nr:oligosaccharide flippase family protein [Burkholderiaceae bacterium]